MNNNSLRLTDMSQYTGSWYPSGYFGHDFDAVRKERNDRFRQLARPPTPPLFLKRLAEPTKKHVFSEHENRRILRSDIFSLLQGGKKRCATAPVKSTTGDYLRWNTGEQEVPSQTSYQVAFSRQNSGTSMQRLYTFLDAAQPHFTSTYGSSYVNWNTATQNLKKQYQPTRKLPTPMWTVADCLTWV
ncbi:hypothetical protein CRM22_007613 [Opisthorchis felineus]|uniref:Uncharacterized protein n=1 Tax=Opisthorchis felineus TaxID=147828 RepID=A0A4S2LF27_OPIFE|nr:hypothetical protein CRM22_007613 [Opisthorchis felineus]